MVIRREAVEVGVANDRVEDAAGDDGVALPKGWAVYVLLCGDGTFYTGISTDVARRLREHGSGRGARYTRTRRPVELVALAPCESRVEASRLEARLKCRSRQGKERFVRDNPPRAPEVAPPAEATAVPA